MLLKPPGYQRALDFSSKEFQEEAQKLHLIAAARIPGLNTTIHKVSDVINIPQGIIRNYPGFPNKHLREIVDINWEFITTTFSYHDKDEIEFLASLLVKQGGFIEQKIAVNFMKRFRFYWVSGIENNQSNPGGNEFHRIRQEILGCWNNSPVILNVKDLFGRERTIQLEWGEFIYIPPFIWHSYYVGDGKMGELFSIVNTNIGWDQESFNKLTFDSYYDAKGTDGPDFPDFKKLSTNIASS